MKVLVCAADADGPFAGRLCDWLAQKGHSAVDSLEEAGLTLGILSPDSVTAPGLLEHWDRAVASTVPLLFLMLRPCAVPPRFARVSFIDVGSNEELGLARLEGVLIALSQPARGAGDATDRLRRLAVSVAGDVSGTLNVAGGDIVVDRREIYLGGPPSAAERIDQRNRRLLLDKVRAFWIEGVLEKSLYRFAAVEMDMKTKPSAVEHPLGMMMEAVGRNTETLPPGTNITQIFDQAGRALLILGAPGSGKTTRLLELARSSLERAEDDPDEAMPVIFHLSSWQPVQPIADWLCEELRGKYGVPAKEARRWLENSAFMPMLDGLDEVRDAIRDDCIVAINRFREEHGLMPIVVCSRIAEYEEAQKKLVLGGAVLLMSLNEAQINSYLKAAGEQLAGLQAALGYDAALRELAENPLMLNVMALACQGMPESDLHSGEVLAHRAHLFQAYIQRMFERSGRKLPYARKGTTRLLRWLARRMREQNQAVFLIERMQPAWLGKGFQRVVFGVLSILAGAVAAGLVAWIGQMGVSFAANLIDALLHGSGGTPLAEFAVRRLAGVLSAGALVGLVSAAAGALVMALSLGREIRTTENLRWSFRLSRRLVGFVTIGALVGGVIGVLVGLAIFSAMVLSVPSPEEAAWVGVIGVSVILGLMFGVIGALSGMLLSGLRSAEMEARLAPNQGMRQTTRNAIMVGLMIWLVTFIGLGTMFTLAFAALTGMPVETFLVALYLGAASGWVFGVVAGLIGGGTAAIKHYVLRLMLWAGRGVPLNLTQFLDHAASLVFLRQVGGGYIFVHRLLMEHFASLPVAR